MIVAEGKAAAGQPRRDPVPTPEAQVLLVDVEIVDHQGRLVRKVQQVRQVHPVDPALLDHLLEAMAAQLVLMMEITDMATAPVTTIRAIPARDMATGTASPSEEPHG